jgi:hypothetical protein
MLRHKKEDFVYCFFSGIVYTYNRKQGSGQKKKRIAKMKNKIFLPCTKKEAIARGFWKNPADGVFYRDFIRYTEADKVTPKILKSYCTEYKQEAIFYEVTNARSGRKTSGVCFYKNGKKDVFKKRLTRYADGVHEAIEAIRKFKNNGLTCYTIQKDGKNRFVIFAWIADVYKAKRQAKQKRILRRNKLLKKLIANLADGENIRYRIQKNINSGGRFNVYSNKVTINPEKIRRYRIKSGYSDVNDYYAGRGTKINPYILHNYKAFLRFVIWHEIGHAVYYKKYINFYHIEKWTIARRERFADAYALRQLKKHFNKGI